MSDYYEYFVSYKYERKKKGSEGTGHKIVRTGKYVNSRSSFLELCKNVQEDFEPEDTVIIVNFIYLNYNGET